MKEIYEYKVIEIFDKSGTVNIKDLAERLNIYGKEGWHLVTAYTNEFGKVGTVVAGIGVNTTTEQNILILERKKELTDDGFDIRDKTESKNDDNEYEIVYNNGRVFASKNSNLYCTKCHAFIDSDLKSMCSNCGASLMES